MSDWSYTFLDARTDTELATLPMVEVTFEKVLNGTGKLTGTVPVVDPKIRAMDPWSATIPRRTCLAVSYGGVMVWYGLVWVRERDHDQPGLKITAATLDSWLATQMPLIDLHYVNKTAVQLITGLIATVQSVPGANLGIAVSDGTTTGSPTAISRNRDWARTDLKDALSQIGSFLTTSTPIEWRFDCSWHPGGGVTKTLVVGEPRIGRTTDVSQLYVWHDVTRSGSTLLSFTDTDDGSVQGNAAVAAVGWPLDRVNTSTVSPPFADVLLTGLGQLSTPQTPAPLNPQTLFSYHSAAELGTDEIAAGYPLIMREVSSVGDRLNIKGQDDLDDQVLGMVADSLAQGRALTNFAVRLDQGDGAGGVAIGSFEVGDDLDCDITHPAYPEFPNVTAMPVRILGRKITPRGPNTADKIELTVWDRSSPRLPRSKTLTAHMRDITRRLKALEQG